MRVPRVRFTVRCMMVAVAVAGVGGGAFAMAGAAKRYRTRAAREAFWESLTRQNFHSEEERIADLQRFTETKWKMAEAATSPSMRKLFQDDARRWEVEKRSADLQRDLFRRQAAYHAAMKRKYWGAARSPWLLVAPDPPPPKP